MSTWHDITKCNYWAHMIFGKWIHTLLRETPLDCGDHVTFPLAPMSGQTFECYEPIFVICWAMNHVFFFWPHDVPCSSTTIIPECKIWFGLIWQIAMKSCKHMMTLVTSWPFLYHYIGHNLKTRSWSLAFFMLWLYFILYIITVDRWLDLCSAGAFQVNLFSQSIVLKYSRMACLKKICIWCIFSGIVEKDN